MIVDDIALTMHPEIGCRTAIHLLDCFDSAGELFAATADEIVQRSGLKPALARSLSRRECHARAEREMEFVLKHRIRAIASGEPEYPRRLKECPDYPHVLYVKGDTDLNGSHWLSVVGTRKITPYGASACERIVGELAELVPDTVVVSGLAYGVDIAAHRAAMNAALPTVAVVAHPLTHIYPPRHTESARRMVAEGGAVVSEFHTGCRSDRSCFVQRNRIIAGLGDGTLVVESAARGGSLITADMADGYHRCVMALPGRVGDTYSEGTNNLIRTLKAQMVCSAADIAELMQWRQARTQPGKPVSAPTLFDPTAAMPEGEAGRIFALLGDDGPVALDELSLRSGLAPRDLAPLLLELDLSGFVRKLPGNAYIKN